jgi:60 kDa SS-A/Ro ribonucleoprotein
MKFNFNLKGRQPAGTRYALIKAEVPDVQSDLLKMLLSVSLSVDDPAQASHAMILLREAVRQGDPEFLGRLAIDLREQRSFRDLAFLLTAELAALYGDDERTGVLVGRIVQQPGKIPGWLDYYTRTVRKRQRPGRAVRKSLSTLLNSMDEYQYSRYSVEIREGIRLALQWLQPKAAGRSQKSLFARIQRGQVPVRTTWLQEWQALHQQHYASPEQRQMVLRDKWKEGISSFRIGYTALLDNLQPMLCAGVSGKVLKLAAEYLGNAAAAGPGGQSPLRLLNVYRSLQRLDQGGAGMLKEALETATLHNSWNRSGFGRRSVSVIAMDVSSSMRHPLEGYGHVQRFDIGPLLAYSWISRGEQVITGVIGNTWRPVQGPVRPILSAVDQFRRHEGEAGYAINAWLVLQDLLRKRQVVDNVLIFTDCPLWDNRTFNQSAGTDLSHWWRAYRREVAPKAKLYLFDLAGYGMKALDWLEEDVYAVAGWHDRIVDVLSMESNFSDAGN